MDELMINEQRINYSPLASREEQIGKIIVESAFKVHKALGPGLLEKVYEVCLTHEIIKSSLNVKRQVDIPITYDGLTFDEGLRPDLLVEDKVICELKAVDQVNPV
jgi:GxxExxY protein